MDLDKNRSQLETLRDDLLLKMSQEETLNFGFVRMLSHVSTSLQAITDLKKSGRVGVDAPS